MGIDVMIYFLLFMLIIFIATTITFFYISYRAVRLNSQYEEFYNETSSDIEAIVESLNTILKKRQILSEDPDVQNLIRGMVIARNIISGYVNVRKTQK